MSTRRDRRSPAAAPITAAIKAVGPVALGGRELPTWFTSVVILLSPALLAALVATQAFAQGDHLALDADTAGVAAGGLVIWRTGSIIACVVLAAAVTAACERSRDPALAEPAVLRPRGGAPRRSGALLPLTLVRLALLLPGLARLVVPRRYALFLCLPGCFAHQPRLQLAPRGRLTAR